MTTTDTLAPPPTPPTTAAPSRHRGKGRPDWVVRGSVSALLAASAVLYLWGLSASGYANSFYSAAAQAGSQNLESWFFGSLDGGNSITVDKPPGAMWLMSLSVRLFGLSSWSILMPEALLGVASVGLLYVTVRRSLLNWRATAAQTHALSPRGAHWAALAGAAVFALTPVATLMFRFNNPDALLVFTMVLASYFTVRATEHAGRTWLVFAGIAIGFGFLTKMLQAFVVLPALVVAYWIAAPATWKKKLVDLLAAFAAVVVSAGWYVAVVELTPASMRPYIGGSQTNSLLELIIGYNGLGRITGSEVGSVGGGGSAGGNWGETGILRMFSGVSGGMVSWLIPAALVLGLGALVLVIVHRGQDAPGLERRQTPTQAISGALVLWLGSLVITAGVFSFMAGIYHDYYSVGLAPAIGAGVALGGTVLWANRGRPSARLLLGITTAGTGVWAVVLLRQAGSWYGVLGWVALVLGCAAGIALVWVDRLPRLIAGVALGTALTAGLAGPAAYSIETAGTAHTGSIVTAGPVSSVGNGGGRGGFSRGPQGGPTGTNPNGNASRGAPPGRTANGTGTTGGVGGGADGGMGGLLNGAQASTEAIAALTTNASSYTWVAATVGSQNAASYQLASGYPVMAIGGFNGSDPSPTLAQFKQYVAEGKIHYFLGDSVGGTQNGGSRAASEIASWVSQNFTATTLGNTTVYDLTRGS